VEPELTGLLLESHLYEAHLRQAVRERVPWAWWGPVRNGIAELEQVPEEVRLEFSQRRRRILEREAELVAAGVSVGHRGRERIACSSPDGLTATRKQVS
jgi:TrwC relaxase